MGRYLILGFGAGLFADGQHADEVVFHMPKLLGYRLFGRHSAHPQNAPSTNSPDQNGPAEAHVWLSALIYADAIGCLWWRFAGLGASRVSAKPAQRQPYGGDDFIQHEPRLVFARSRPFFCDASPARLEARPGHA
jgi:hypothetical protein